MLDVQSVRGKKEEKKHNSLFIPTQEVDYGLIWGGGGEMDGLHCQSVWLGNQQVENQRWLDKQKRSMARTNGLPISRNYSEVNIHEGWR